MRAPTERVCRRRDTRRAMPGGSVVQLTPTVVSPSLSSKSSLPVYAEEAWWGEHSQTYAMEELLTTIASTSTSYHATRLFLSSLCHVAQGLGSSSSSDTAWARRALALVRAALGRFRSFNGRQQQLALHTGQCCRYATRCPQLRHLFDQGGS